jgi:hypothetical protein
MKCATEMDSGGIIFVSSSMTTGNNITIITATI